MTAPPPAAAVSAAPPVASTRTASVAAVARTAVALLAASPLITAAAAETIPRVTPLPGPVTASTVAAVQLVLDRLSQGLGIPGLAVVARADGLTTAELVVSGHLPLTDLAAVAHLMATLPDRDIEAVVATTLAATPRPTMVVSHDGAVLPTYAAGPEDAPTVVVVSACGMPVGLVGGWLAALSQSFRVITWESRGLFDDDPAFDDRPYDLAAQAGDVTAVLTSFGVKQAHLMGLCGGAPIALAAAAMAGASTSAGGPVASLSLWHGDYELAGRAPKTQHQQDVQAMLTIAARGRVQAASLCRLFARPATVAKLRPDVAHHIFYPYANPELLYRYGRLNGAIMTTDCGPLLGATEQPTLVVTSPQDSTAHPQGSLYVAEHLVAGRLALMPDGDHLAAFDAAPTLVELAAAFIHETMGRAALDTGPGAG